MDLLDLKVTQGHLACLDIRDLLVSKETLDCQVQKVKGDIVDLQVHWEGLVNQVQWDQEVQWEKVEILGPLENRVQVEIEEEKEPGEKQANLVTLDPRDSLEWKEDQVLQVLLDLQDHQETQSQWLQLLSLEVRLYLVCQDLLVLEDLLVLLVREELEEGEVLREGEVPLVLLVVLGVLVDRGCLAELVILGLLAKMEDQEELIQRMT